MVDFWIHDTFLEIEPNLLLLTTIVRTTGHGALFVNRAAAATGLKMGAITVLAFRYQVGLSQIPTQNSFPDILTGQREGKTATRGSAELYACRTIDFDFVLEVVLVVLRCL
jgi:hypothetical protein